MQNEPPRFSSSRDERGNLTVPSWSSFRRQLVSYHFPMVDYGSNTGIFQNPQFLRGRPELCALIERDDRYDSETISSKIYDDENDL